MDTRRRDFAAVRAQQASNTQTHGTPLGEQTHVTGTVVMLSLALHNLHRRRNQEAAQWLLMLVVPGPAWSSVRDRTFRRGLRLSSLWMFFNLFQCAMEPDVCANGSVSSFESLHNAAPEGESFSRILCESFTKWTQQVFSESLQTKAVKAEEGKIRTYVVQSQSFVQRCQ